MNVTGYHFAHHQELSAIKFAQHLADTSGQKWGVLDSDRGCDVVPLPLEKPQSLLEVCSPCGVLS